MCYSPLRLRTNKKVFNPRTDKLYNTFPCGQCGSCRTRKQQDWTIRCHYEHKRVVKNKGVSLFVTFTYNDDSLPYLLVNNKRINCFSKYHVRYFCDRFRDLLEAKFNTTYNFRYFITSEYGGKTFRPHYHGAFHFDSIKDSLSTLNQIKHLIRESWPHGFVSFGSINGGVVMDIRALTYVAKYVSKDLDFGGNRELKEYLDDLKISNFRLKKYNDYTYDKTFGCYLAKPRELDQYLQIKNEVSPFHLESVGYGAYALDCLDKDLAERGLIKVPDYKTGTYKTVHLPLYFERKLFYQLTEDNSYELTPYGCYVRQLREDELKSNLKENINNVFKNIPNSLNQESLQYVNNLLGRSYDSPSSLMSFVNLKLKSVSLDDLVDYVHNLRDMVFVDDINLFEEVQRPSYHSRYIYSQRGLSHSDLYPDDKLDFQKLKGRLFNSLHDYLTHEDLFSIYSAIVCALGVQQNRYYLKKEQTYSKLKLHGYQ